jgi:hypothetical protein
MPVMPVFPLDVTNQFPNYASMYLSLSFLKQQKKKKLVGMETGITRICTILIFFWE